MFVKSDYCGPNVVRLVDLSPGQSACVCRVEGDSVFKRRLSALGVVRGHQVMLDQMAPFGNPRLYTVLGYQICLRNEDARKILLNVSPLIP